MPWCPECGNEYGPEVAACPGCRAVLSAEAPGVADQDEPVVAHRVPDAAAGALLCGMLENHDIQAVLRSATLPGYGFVRRDWGTSAWGEILVPRSELGEAKGLIADYLDALDRGGTVTDQDVEGI